jgi:hypothetical protein
MFRSSSLARPPEQLRQPSNVGGNPSRLVLRQHLRSQRFGFVLSRADVRERLPVGVPDDMAAGHLVSTPWCGEAASSRARRRDRVWPPPHRRHLERRSLPRIDPAGRCSPTWPLERIRCAATVCYLQRDIFIERNALDWIPAVVCARRLHYAVPNSKRPRAGSQVPATGRDLLRRRCT